MKKKSLAAGTPHPTNPDLDLHAELIAANKLLVNVDTHAYPSKPSRGEVGGVSQRLAYNQDCIQELEWLDFVQLILAGHSFTQGLFPTGLGRKEDTWAAQYMVWADIDNEKENVLMQSPEDIVEILSSFGLAPACMYFSFSHTEEHPKFRVGCRFNRVVLDKEEALKINQAFTSLFIQADPVATDLPRLFFGTSFSNAFASLDTIDPDILLSIWESRCKPTPASSKKRNQATKAHEEDIDLQEAIATFPFAEWVKEVAPGNYVDCGSHWQMKKGECPICGHNDCFTIKDYGYHCKSSSSHAEGGNIITYLMSTESLTLEEARSSFKYGILGDTRQEEKRRYAELQQNKRATALREVGVIEDGQSRPVYIIDNVDARGTFKGEKVSPQLLYQFIKEGTYYFFCKDSTKNTVQRYWYIDGYYRQVGDIELRGIIKAYIESYNLMLVSSSVINETFNLLVNDVLFHDMSNLNSDENIINFQNGILDLNTMHLLPHDPQYLCTTQIPCDWNPAAESPLFDAYLDTLLNGDMEMAELLLEYIGAIISNIKGWRMKKALFLTGVGDSGKSQLMTVVQRLIGRGNFSSVDLGELESRFGTSQLYNKRLAGSADMSYLTVSELKIFKKITGGDTLFAEYKGENGFEFRFEGLLWFCCNELPKFGGDHGKWVYDRMLVINAVNAIPKEQQDRQLADKLYAEREGIVYKCIQAVCRLIQRGFAFAIPESSTQEVYKWEVENNTVLAFYKQCCVDRPPLIKGGFRITDSVSCATLYKFYVAWAKHSHSRGFHVAERDFKKHLEAQCVLSTPRKRTATNNFYFCTITLETYNNHREQVGKGFVDPAFEQQNLCARGIGMLREDTNNTCTQRMEDQQTG